MNESYQTYHISRCINMCVMTHSYVTHMNEPCQTYEGAMSHYERVKSHITHILLPHALTCVSWLTIQSHDTFICVTQIIHTCAQAYVCECILPPDASTRVSWLTHQSHDVFGCVTQIMYTCAQAYVCACILPPDALTRVLWLIRVMTHLYVWHESFICVCGYTHTWMSHITHMNASHTWISHVTHMNASHTWMRHVIYMNESYTYMSHVTHMNESCHTHESVMSRIWMSHVTLWKSQVTHTNESCHT